MPDFSQRSPQTEWMDTEAVSEADFAACLRDLSTVNTLTLARRPTVNWMRRVARGMPAGAMLSVLDVGFGQGDMLRRIHRWGTRRGLRLRLVGVDLNPSSAAAAAAWPTVETPAVAWPCMLNMPRISRAGPPPKPMRQPVMA